jgi:hypothetical protein
MIPFSTGPTGPMGFGQTVEFIDEGQRETSQRGEIV